MPRTRSHPAPDASPAVLTSASAIALRHSRGQDVAGEKASASCVVQRLKRGMHSLSPGPWCPVSPRRAADGSTGSQVRWLGASTSYRAGGTDAGGLPFAEASRQRQAVARSDRAEARLLIAGALVAASGRVGGRITTRGLRGPCLPPFACNPEIGDSGGAARVGHKSEAALSRVSVTHRPLSRHGQAGDPAV